MKIVVQLFLVFGGFFGLCVSVPTAIFGWKMHHGFGGDLTSSDFLVLYGPLFCVVALVAGYLWIRNDKKHEPKRRPGNLTENAGGGET